ncbi:MAG TPA: hypothetical protein VLC09_14065 [Polyangiaceae bacterium]|nr:hypothetical protein [Polyangiaceae bacterium]
MKIAFLGLVAVGTALALGTVACTDNTVENDESQGGGGAGGGAPECSKGLSLREGSDERCPVCQPAQVACEIVDLFCEYEGGWNASCACRADEAAGGGGAGGAGGAGGTSSLAWECAL